MHCIIAYDRISFFENVKRVLRDGGIFIGFTMCGEAPDCLKEFFDTKSRNIIKNGIAGRYIGTVNILLREFEDNGFKILEHSIDSAKNKYDDTDTLIYILKKNKK